MESESANGPTAVAALRNDRLLCDAEAVEADCGRDGRDTNRAGRGRTGRIHRLHPGDAGRNHHRVCGAAAETRISLTDACRGRIGSGEADRGDQRLHTGAVEGAAACPVGFDYASSVPSDLEREKDGDNPLAAVACVYQIYAAKSELSFPPTLTCSSSETVTSNSTPCCCCCSSTEPCQSWTAAASSPSSLA